jgi:hypothetical protein
MRNPKAVVALHGLGSVCPGHRDVKWGRLRTPAEAVGIPATLELCTSLVAPGGAVPTSSRAAPTPVISGRTNATSSGFGMVIAQRLR